MQRIKAINWRLFGWPAMWTVLFLGIRLATTGLHGTWNQKLIEAFIGYTCFFSARLIRVVVEDFIYDLGETNPDGNMRVSYPTYVGIRALDWARRLIWFMGVYWLILSGNPDQTKHLLGGLQVLVFIGLWVALALWGYTRRDTPPHGLTIYHNRLRGPNQSFRKWPWSTADFQVITEGWQGGSLKISLAGKNNLWRLPVLIQDVILYFDLEALVGWQRINASVDRFQTELGLWVIETVAEEAARYEGPEGFFGQDWTQRRFRTVICNLPVIWQIQERTFSILPIQLHIQKP